MNKKLPVLLVFVLACTLVQAGYLGSQLAYNAGFSTAAVPFAAGNFATAYGSAPFATPLPVTTYKASHHPYAFGYSSQPVVKFRNFGPFTTYASVRAHHKFAYPAPVPSLYNTPPGVACDDAAPPVFYNDYPAPNTVLKFGPPITTTTTTYSTTAAAAAPVAPVAVANSFNGVAGW